MLATQIDDLIRQISDKIKYANQVIKSIEFDIKDENIVNWKLRLEHRVNELELTKTILRQNKSQIKLLLGNGDTIVNKLDKEQTNLLMIVERKKQEQESRETISLIKSYIDDKCNKREMTKSEIEKIKQQNKILINALDELTYVHEEKVKLVNGLKNR